MRPITTFTALLMLATPAFAQDSGNGINFTFGLGGVSQPSYFGAETDVAGVTAGFTLNRLQFGSIKLGGEDKFGFAPKASLRTIGARTVADNAELAGLADIDLAVELGGGLQYSQDYFMVYAVARRGFGGHEGWVGEAGGDLIMTPSDKLELRVGPRIAWGDDTFADTYFSDSRAGFVAQSGIVSHGVTASASYAIADTWGVMGAVSYDRLLNDAAASPISKSDDQTTVSLIVTRTFDWSF